MLAPASFAMASKKSEEECSQELSERMHTLVGYRHDDWVGSDWVHEIERFGTTSPNLLEKKARRGDCHDGDS